MYELYKYFTLRKLCYATACVLPILHVAVAIHDIDDIQIEFCIFIVIFI